MKLLLVIDLVDNVAEEYKDFTVDYFLRGTPIDDEKVIESIKYVEDANVRPLPLKGTMENVDECEYNRGFVDGRNHCIDLIVGKTE